MGIRACCFEFVNSTFESAFTNPENAGWGSWNPDGLFFSGSHSGSSGQKWWVISIINQYFYLFTFLNKWVDEETFSSIDLISSHAICPNTKHMSIPCYWMVDRYRALHLAVDQKMLWRTSSLLHCNASSSIITAAACIQRCMVSDSH